MGKKLVVLFTYFFFAQSNVVLSQATWQQQFPNPTSKVLIVPYFISQELGWVVGQDGIIIKTIDGGNSWQIQTSPINHYLTSCFFLDENVGFITGFYGTILKTTDGGSTWIIKPSASSTWITSIEFTNSYQGFALTADSLLKTIDGGETWQRINTNNSQLQLSMYFMNDSVGWIGCANGKLMKTYDGGLTWNEINTGFSSTTLQWLKFIDSNTGFAGGNEGIFQYHGRILKTIDGGLSWSLVFSSIDEFRFSDFLNENTAYFVNNDNIVYATYDAFNSINTVYNPNDSTGSYIQLSGAQFPTDSTGYIVGSDGFIAKTTNQFSSLQKLSKTIDFVTNSMSAPDPLHIWATDNYYGNLVVRSSHDGGHIWSYMVPDSAISWYLVCFTDSLHGWIAGYEIPSFLPKVGITEDGGLSWNIVSINSNTSIFSMTFNDESYGWLGSGNKIFRTTDGGYTWNFATIDPALYVRNLDFINNQEGWLVGTDPYGTQRFVYRTLDSGATWQAIFADAIGSGYLTEIDFVNSNVGFMSGAFYDFRLYKTIDGGFTWTLMDFDPNVDSVLSSGYFGDLKVTSLNKAWFCGGNLNYQGFIIGTQDGGATWQLQLVKDGIENVQSLCFVNDFIGWASAYHGYFYKLNLATEYEAITNELNNASVLIFPNPASDDVHLSFTIDKSSDVMIAVWDFAGRKLLCKHLGYLSKGSFQSVISVDDLSSGIYQVTVNIGTMCIHQKLLKF